MRRAGQHQELFAAYGLINPVRNMLGTLVDVYMSFCYVSLLSFKQHPYLITTLDK